jgi:heat shock protein HtpX
MGRNLIKLTVLLTTLTVLFVLIGQVAGGTGGLVIAAIFAVLLNGGAYWFSDKLVLRMAGARQVSADEAPDLHRLVASLAQRAALPMPRVYLIESDTPNAFATGRSPRHGVVAVTTGISRLLTRDELAGVIAHELAHIKHRDTLLSAVVATIAGAITMIANLGQWTLLFGGLAGDDEEGGGWLGGLLWLFIAPIAATLIQLGISRAREFQADARGARIMGDPLPLASALEKLEWAARREPLATSPATASLYIVNPFNGASALRLFSTHPPVEARITRLRALTLREPRSGGREALA